MKQFEIGGATYEVERLKPQAACRGWAVVTDVLGPALDQLGTQGGFLRAVGGAVGRLPELVAVFAPVTTFAHPELGGGKRLPLKTFADQLPATIADGLLFVATCIEHEYADFLGTLESGALEDRLGELFPSLKARKAGSGESP